MPPEQKFTAEKVRTLLGKPRLMPGESEEAYQGLWEAFVEEYQPETLAEWLDVDQLVAKQWEQGRLRRSNTALIENTMWQALRSLLRELRAPSGVSPKGKPALNFGNEPSRLAREYYFGNGDERKLAMQKVREWGIFEEHILAEALQMRAAETICFDRMDNYRTNSKRALRKNLQLSSRSREKSPEISIN